MKELKKEDRDTSNKMMLPRQANNSKKYELKKKNSFESKQKLTGMAAIQINIENKKVSKTKSSRPQTAMYKKGNLAKPKTGIPSIGKLGNRTKSKSENTNNRLKGVNQNRIQTLLQNNPSGAAAVMNKQIINDEGKSLN